MWYFRDFYPRSRPRAVRGGIKAQSRSGAFGKSWWAQRWIAVLESFNIGARLSRGKSYARQGQVVSIDIAEGEVRAKVQGSRPKPYDICIKVKTLTENEWKKVVKELGTQAAFTAKLLTGEMPQEIEQVFQSAEVSLFPQKLKDLQTKCSCPDWSNPCKHIAAVYYLIGEEFDRDPFLIFKLRGLDREELFERLGTNRKAKVRETEEDEPAPAEPLVADMESYWNGQALPDDFFGEVRVAPVHAALPRRLGNFPFWRGRERFLDALTPVYRQAAQTGLSTYLGESS